MTGADENYNNHTKEFSDLFNNMNDTAFVHDLNGNFLNINDTAVHRLGYSKEELLSMGPQNIDAPEYAEKVSGIIKQISKDKQLTFESVHITKNGERIPVEISSTIIHYRGQPAIISIARDITDRKRAEINEKRYRLLFENADDAIFILDGEKDYLGDIVDANQKAADIHGYTLDEILNMHITDLDTKDAANEFSNRIQRTLNGEWIKDELSHLRKNGDIIQLEANAGMVELDGHKYILAIERDITERKKMESDLRKTENKYRTIFETTGTSTATASDDTTIQLINKEFEKLSGYSRQEIEGKKSWTDFISNKDLEHLYNDFEMLLSDPESIPDKNEFQFIDRNNNQKDVSMVINSMPEEKTIVASLLDITERKQLEYTLRKERDQLDKQNQIRSILTSILPTLLKESPKEKRKVILKQMIDMIEKCMFHHECDQMSQFEYEDIDSSNVGSMSCEVMNQLGGNFEVEKSDNNNVNFAVKGTGCPWGVEQAQLNPMLCRLTKGIISRVILHVHDNAKVNTLKTMGHGDDCCYFEVSLPD